MTPMTAAPGLTPPEIVYPFCDGKPLAQSIEQLRWITLLYGNLDSMFRDRADVFVGGDNFWYPVEGEPDIVFAPDVYVVFGRPKGDRASYKQWLEGDIPLTVVFEVLSPANTTEEMVKKFDFYDHYGVEEYYVYDPDHNKLQIYTRGMATLRLHRDIAQFVSPRLGIRFEMTKPEMTVYKPNGVRFRSVGELDVLIEEEKGRADEAKRQADEARHQAEAASRFNVRLKELSRKARRGQATPDEIAELERLEDESL